MLYRNVFCWYYNSDIIKGLTQIYDDNNYTITGSSSHDLEVDFSFPLGYRGKGLTTAHATDQTYKLCLGILMVLQLLSLSLTILNE